jgi:quinol monooxygenase YgiN
MFSILAKITSDPKESSFVKQELQKLIEPSRSKEGCISYTMYEDSKKENIFYFVEKWASKEVFAKHMSSPLIVDYAKKTEGKILQLELTKMNEVEV